MSTTTTPVTASPSYRPRLYARLRNPLVGPSVFFVLAVIAFVVIPAIDQGKLVSSFDMFNSLEPFADMGFVALGLALTMICGEFDLSVVGSYGLGAMVGVKLGQTDPIVGLLAAIGVGGMAGLIQGVVIARTTIGSVPVSLGGLLVMVGLTYSIGGGQNVSFTNISFGLNVNEALGSVLPLLAAIILGVAAAIALLVRYTAVGRLLRAVGGDRSVSATLGLPVSRILTGAFTLSGAMSAVGGALTAYTLVSADSNVSFTPLTFAVTAALIGGVALSGGRGSVAGVTAAAIGLSLIQGVLQVIAAPEYLVNVVTGVILVVVAFAQAPGLRDLAERRRARLGVGAAGGNGMADAVAVSELGRRS